MPRIRRTHRPRSFEALIEPLGADERGRGHILPPARQAELKAECLRLIRMGATSDQIRLLLNLSKSAASRWCRLAIAEGGIHADRRFINVRHQTILQAAWARTEIATEDGACWEWLGAKGENGYGKLSFEGVCHYAHRIIYEHLVAPIPRGKVVDHICCNRGCVRPDHLQAINQSENLLLVAVRTIGGGVVPRDGAE